MPAIIARLERVERSLRSTVGEPQVLQRGDPGYDDFVAQTTAHMRDDDESEDVLGFSVKVPE